MRRWKKGAEPEAFKKKRQAPGAGWNSLGKQERDEMRKELCLIQHGLCCFCQSRIDPDATEESRKIRLAHFVPRNPPTPLSKQDADQLAALPATLGKGELDWDNIWGACPGGEGQDKQFHHCDKKQVNDVLPAALHPSLYVEGTIRYKINEKDGYPEVWSKDEVIKHALNDRLALNIMRLKRNRYYAKEQMKIRIGRGQWSAADIQRKIEEFTDPDVLNWPEFHEYLLLWLNKRLKGTAAGKTKPPGTKGPR